MGQEKWIKPTVGRVVLYYPALHQPNAQPWAAIVAHVWSDTVVNLAIFDANGVPAMNPPTSVPLVQPGEPVPTGVGYCTWMPYQLGHAEWTRPAEAKGVIPVLGEITG